MSLQEAETWQNSRNMRDRLIGTFVRFWWAYPKLGFKAWEFVVKSNLDLSADPNVIQAILMLTHDPREYDRLCDVFFSVADTMYLSRTLDFFITNGYDVNQNRINQLLHAVNSPASSCPEPIKLLIDHSAQVNSGNSFRKTAGALQSVSLDEVDRASKFIARYLQPPSQQQPMHIVSSNNLSRSSGSRSDERIRSQPETPPQCVRMVGTSSAGRDQQPQVNASRGQPFVFGCSAGFNSRKNFVPPMLEMARPVEYVAPHEALQVPSPAEGVQLDLGDHFGLLADSPQRVTFTPRPESSVMCSPERTHVAVADTNSNSVNIHEVTNDALGEGISYHLPSGCSFAEESEIDDREIDYIDSIDEVVIFGDYENSLRQIKERENQLIMHASIGNTKGVKRLLRLGVNINAYNEQGETALWLAARNHYTKMLARLLKKGGDINVKNAHGYTPLMMAARLGALGLVLMLLEKGANINVENADGNTALMIATMNGAFDLVKLLITRGADRNYMNHRGERAYDMVPQVPGSDIIRELLRPYETDLRVENESLISQLLQHQAGDFLARRQAREL
jgi:hypothetical protein